MKPPYLNITANCERCGQFRLQRKPRPRIKTDSGQIQLPEYEAVVCPACRCWGKITEQVLITKEEITT